LSQSRKATLVEVLLGTAFGFVASVVIGHYVYIAYGHQFTVADNTQITAIFTVWSIFRSYWQRRFFNYLHVKGILQ
jgi:hypothetical protein